ncbi:uncharacterized protein LOC133659119 [Entelurus aequoreus]|uniref:uncharacterized protein LOC133659119 n=1 Tax=Entelurus aequoreus TaxID=161455 RepID=UPI002B1D96C7|nr:uncharacterized protein LOC133659119 [Entelurus aequoreus]
MADPKPTDELKVERATAKRQFSRLANNITRTYIEMSKEELQENFKKLMLESSRVFEANEEVEAAYMADAEELSDPQKADIAKTEKECEQKTKEVKLLIRETLWTTYGEKELSLALQVAEAEFRNVSFQPDTTLEACEFMLTHLQKLVDKAKEAHQNWNHWAPLAEKKDFDYRLRELEVVLPKLVSQKAPLIQAASIKKDAGPQPISARSSAPVAAIKLKATALPKFAGNQRNYYRWRKEWEALQKQGEPTGSSEVKKFQLLDSLDEKVARELRLSTYSSADEIFRVLENRFGNQASIALEIIEELQARPSARSGHPRKIVELIQTVEKALYDLNELDNADALKNPLVIRSIESKLPETLKKDWLTYAADRGNTVNPQNRFDKLITFLKSQESIYEQLDQLSNVFEPTKEQTKLIKYARTKSAKSSSETAGCIICGDPKHRRRLYFCRRFRINLKPSEKRDAAQQLGACKRCLEVHSSDPCRNTTCQTPVPKNT